MYCIICAGPFLSTSDEKSDVFQTLASTCKWLGHAVGIPVYPLVASLLPLTLSSYDNRVWQISPESIIEYAKVTPVRLDEKVTFTTSRTDLRRDIHIKPISHIYGIVCHRQCYRLLKKLVTPKNNAGMQQAHMDALVKSIWLWKERDESTNLVHNMSYSVNMQLRPASGFVYASASSEMDMLTDPMLTHSNNGERIRKLWRFFRQMKKTSSLLMSCLDPWMVAARSGNVDMMKKHVSDYLNRYDEIGFTALHWAIDFKRWDVVKFLLKHNIKIQHVSLLKPLMEMNTAHPMILKILQQMEH